VLRYRYLFEQMVRRELHPRYKGSAVGVLWYLVGLEREKGRGGEA
jgi:ABC-type polysaccharide/polyol phosphate export permease